MTLNTKKAMVPHIQVTTKPETQISLHLALRPAVFESQSIFETSELNESNMTLTLKGQV